MTVFGLTAPARLESLLRKILGIRVSISSSTDGNLRTGRSERMNLLCLLSGHHRSKRRARLTEEGWCSVCRYCGKRMVRMGPQDWRLAAADEAPPSDEG